MLPTYDAAIVMNQASPVVSLASTVLLLAGLVTACSSAPAVGESRLVMLPPKPANCPLQLVTIGPSDMMPGARFGAGGKYQMIGTISVGLKVGTNVLSEKVRQLVRPRACGMGGEVVSLAAEGDAAHYVFSGGGVYTKTQTEALFSVWGPRTANPGPQKF